MKARNDGLIGCCTNHHYFIEDVCPHCSGAPVDYVTFRQGDCVECGQLCQDSIYCCHSPAPIKVGIFGRMMRP